MVGAGPGDINLLTMAAFKAIETADVILFDDLVSQEVIALARSETKLIHVGKRGYRPSCKQTDINAAIVKLALDGNHVVRLKSGDPLIFGRAGEEIAACEAAGIDVQIVPGITSAQGAAARLHTSLTHRDHARRVQYITGHDRNGVLPTELNWQAIADPHATTVVYMPLRTMRELTARAISLGLPPGTAAVAVANATRSNETILYSTVACLADDLERQQPGSPVVVMIGNVFAKK